MRHDRRVPSFDVDAIDLVALRERQSAKYQYYDADVIPAWVAEMDFPLAAPVAAALHAAIDRSDTGYRSAIGLADALADFARDRWDWDIPRERITPVADVLTGAAWAIRLLTEPGDGVVVTPPVYTPFFSTIRDITQRTVVEVPMRRAEDGSYDWDLALLERGVRAARRLGLPHVEPAQPDRHRAHAGGAGRHRRLSQQPTASR